MNTAQKSCQATVYQAYVWRLTRATREGKLHKFNEMQDLGQSLLYTAAALSQCYLMEMHEQMGAPQPVIKER